MASFSEWSNNKMRQTTGTAKPTGAAQKAQSFSAWSNQKLGKEDAQQHPASGNTAFDRSGKTRDEYDSSVRQNYAARAAASDKLTEGEYNRSTAMQRKYGSYQNYLVGATADGKYYSQPKLGADMDRKYNTVTTYEANAKKKAQALQSANETAGSLYTKLSELSGKLPELQQYAGSSTIASGIVQQMQQEYASTLKQYEDATKAVDAAYAAYEPAWNQYKQAAEDYEAYRTEQQNLLDNWKKTIRTDENAINADLTAAQDNVKQLQAQQKELQKQAQQLMNKVSSRRGGTNELMQWSQQAQALQAQVKAMDGQITEAQGAVDLLQEELDWADYYRYADLSADDKAIGQYGKGNIDLHNRPQYQNPDGSVSTVDSTSYNIDGKEVLLPTVWMKDGKPYHSHDDEEILQHYEETGEYLGKFDTPEEADEYGEQLHRAQDFYYGSQYKSTANGKKRSNLDILFDNYSDDASGWDDPLYEYINGNSEAGAYITSQAGANYGGDSNPLGALFGMATENRSESQQMTDEEVAIFNYLYASQGKDAAHAYYDYLTSDLNYRQRQEEEAYWRDYAKESPVGSSVFSVLTSPMKGLSYLGQAADYLGTGTIDQNAAYNRFSYANNAIRNQVAETIEQSGNWGKAGSFLYQTGMSMGDFLLNTAITGGFGGGGALSEGMSLAIMGTGAAADATIAAKDRGLTDTQAFTLGTIAGAAEVFTEKFSIEALLKGKWEDGAIKYILKNAFTEGAEEVGSDFINLFADILIAKDKSEWQQTIDAYMAEGKTEGEAFGLAVAQQAAEMGLDFLGGALSGGTMATAGVGIGTVQRNAGYQQTGSTLRKMGDEMVNSIIETAEKLDQSSEAYKLGQELKDKLSHGKKLTDTEIGRLFAETAGALESTEQTERQAGTAQEQAKGVVLPTADKTEGTVLPTAEQAETRTQQRTTEQERQTAPLRETMETEQPGVLPTAEQAETRQRAARAETETERTGILAGVDEDTIAKVQRISNIVGREVVFFDEGADNAGGMHNGYYNPADGKIYVNARSQNPVAQIISHELTHSIEASGRYSDLQKLVLNRIQQTGGDLQTMRQQKVELYARHGENLTDSAAIDSEIVAEYVEKYLLTDEQSIRAMVQQNRTLGQRILQFINELLAKLGNSDAQERAFLTQAKNYYQSALQETQSSFTADMQQRAATQAQNMDALQQQMANGEISDEDAEAAFNDMYDPEIDMQQGLGRLQHSYAGANANGANLESLREAQEMQQAGADMESIRKATGWHEGMDGKWRYEIDDSRMQLRTDAANIPTYTTLGELVDAPELFEAYPDMADLSVTFHTLEDGQNGGYSRVFDSIELSRDLKNKPEALLNSLIHEAQHAVQNREDFASGANPAYWNRRMENGFDSRTAAERREGARLQEQYEQMRESDPQFVAAMEELDDMAPTVPRGKIDLNTWEQIEPDPPEWVRYDERRDQLEEQYGDRVWDWYSLHDSIDRNARNGGRMPTDLYRDTAGEIEARDTAKRRELTTEERRETSPDYGSEDTVFAHDGRSYAIGQTTDNKPFVEVEQDILAGVPEADWVKTVKENLKKKFPNGITVGNSEIHIDKQSRREMTFSRYMQQLYNSDPKLRADKLRATDNADEILQAATDWVNEGLKHPRKDNIKDFARGEVLLRVGGNDYTAEVVVGTRENGSMLLYDILNLQPTSFTEKETDAAITVNPSPGAGRNTASVSDDSVAEKLPPVKKRFSIDEPVERTKDLIAVHNKDWSVIRDAALNWGGIPSPSVAIVDAQEGHTKYGDTSVVFPRATIDPEADPRNKVYGGDAWTPTKDNAIVEREVNYEARRAFDENIKKLSSQFAGGVFQGSSTLGKIGLENETRWEPEEIADKLANHPEVQAAYLQSEGKQLEPVRRDKQFDRFFSNETIRRYIDTVGEQEVARLAVKLMTGERLTAEEMRPAEQAIREVYAEEHANFLNRRPESKEKRIDYYMENNVFQNRVEDFIRNAQEFYESGGSAGEIDKEATAAKMMEMIAPGGSWNDALRTVKDWVKPQLEGLLGERGIYNGKDTVTDRGRRSFAETHWDYTAENIVKAMNMAAAKGANVYGITPETLAATATQEYKTVDEMHADEARLRTVSEEEHAKALRDLGIYLDRMVNDLMLTTMHKYDNSFEEEQNLSGIIAEAAKGKKTTAAVKAAFHKEGYAISDGHARSILALIDRAANIPTGYYEAKPQRVVGFDEALAVVAPDNAPADLLGEMRNAGMNVVEYKAGDEADRLAKVNSIEKARFSVDEDGGSLPDDERDKRENTRLTPEQKEQLERARARARGDAPRMQDFDNVDDYFAAMRQRAEAERKKRMRNVPKEEFEGTEALQDLGIKIENSAGLYQNVEQMIENDKAAKKIQREIRRAEKRLSVTPKEKSYAAGIAAGIYDADDIPSRMNASKVMELADYYTAEQAMKSDTIPMQRQDISQNLRVQAAELFKDTGNDTFEKKYEKALFSPKGGLALYHRTPQRSMRAIFGWEQGQKINEAIFEPVYVNEQERKRFVNRMHDEVRRFEDKNGKQTALTEKERALTQLVIEGKAVAELVAASDMKEQLIHAAENLKAGGEMADVSQEFGLHDKEARDLARRYADWLQTQEDLAGTDVDQTKVEHAVEAYRTLYDKFYKAINHFLVAHGYEPIGFIKGYAPHFQPEAESGKLEKALKSIGVDLGAEAGSLPASIAGLTKAFKPNKRYNPFFQHRAGKSTEYDVEKGFEKYVDYLSDVLYHTDDIMRVRAAVKYFREEYGPDEISAEISRAESLRFAPKEAKESFLKSAGLLTNTSDLSYADLSAKMEEYVEGLFDSIKKTSKYSDLTVWLDDYANKLAGKQLFSDRDMEREVGRTSLNVGRKLNKMFARANVAGNLSSSLNQTAQLPMIAGEIGPKYVIKAVNDIIAGKTKGDFADQSDFLTEKNGIDYLTNDKGSKITSALFWPLERMDYLISSIAVRGKYRKELDAGRSPKEAMKAADRWARDIMGTRSKGAAPLTFQSKNLIAQMVNMFQVEALNSWEHVTQDLFGPGLKEAEAKLGKEEAAKRLAGIIVATLLGAFLLNRVAEEGYGGTPAQFDVIGLLVGFLASGNGLSTNEQIASWIDDAWESGTGERLFGTDANAGNDEFDVGAAAEDTLYNVSNDIPYLRNAAGLLGLGDQTLPMPDIYGTVTGTAKAVKDNGPFSEEVMRQLMGLAGDTLPGGRQAEKTYQGIETLLKGGYYKGSGEDERLQYPVSDDFWNVVQATMFGRNALSETRDFYAAGGKGLSAAQTRLYKQLVDMGADNETVYDAILAWKKIDGNEDLSKAERETARFELVQSLPLTSEERELLHNTLSGSDTKYSAADAAKAQGIPVGTYQKFQMDAAALESDRDKDGNVIRNSKKEKVLKLIDSLPLNKAQKDWLYLNEGYAESKLDETPWQ